MHLTSTSLLYRAPSISSKRGTNVSVRFFYSAMAGLSARHMIWGSRFFPSDDSYSGLMFRGVTMRRHFSIAPARLGRNEIARGIEGEVAIKSFLEAGLDLGSNA